jgi:hypothetical protein
MFTRPADIADDVVSAVVQEAWQLRIGRIDYAPVGFGSYHWHAWADEDRWFVTADDLVTGGSHLGTSPKSGRGGWPLHWVPQDYSALTG